MLNIKPFALSDVPEAHALSLKIGWPHRLEDWQFAARLGQGYSARQDGELVGTCLTWHLGQAVSCLGLLIVDAKAGRQGLGRRLLRACMNDLGDRTVMLNATEIAEQLYLSEGFGRVGEVIQVQGVVALSSLQMNEPDLAIRALEAADYPSLFALDQLASGVDREDVLREVLVTGQGVVLLDQRVIVGFAVYRPFGRGVVIGPVVGRSIDEGQFMTQQLLGKLPGQFVRLDMNASEMKNLFVQFVQG